MISPQRRRKRRKRRRRRAFDFCQKTNAPPKRSEGG